jgi:hypothetical protein
MKTSFDQLTHCTDIADLRPALQSLCSNFGSLSRLDILPASQGGKRQALCFLRMATFEQERRLMDELGVGRFGGDLIVVVDLQPEDEVQTRFMPLTSRSEAPRERAQA